MSIETDLHKTLRYFSYSRYPLTAFEVWKWQYEPEQIWSYAEVVQALANSPWSCFRGMYALGSVEEVRAQFEERQRRYRNAIQKERKLRSVLSGISRLKDVRAAAICNSLPFHFTEERSDIDIFVIVREGHLWGVRLACVAPLMVLRQRPGEAETDPVDVSFFVSEDALDLEGLKIRPHDPYMAFWVKTLTPVLGREELWDRFFQKNDWADRYLPNAKKPMRAAAARMPVRRSWIPSLPESFAERVQRRRLPEDLRKLANRDSRVVISREMLKFHKNDRRAEIRDHFDCV